MSTVPQIVLSKSDDARVNKEWKDTMPDGWNWKTDNPFARYIAAGIDSNVYSDTSNVR
ncbi:MAG: hypothetical protein MJZ22_04435 [Candidatus Saccharibacteria bacterium]|nr:hypothetical protein [Candidatus Saccharibacteria bacterium]